MRGGGLLEPREGVEGEYGSLKPEHLPKVLGVGQGCYNVIGVPSTVYDIVQCTF